MSTLFAYINPFTTALLLQVLAMVFLCGSVFFLQIKTFVLGLFGITKKGEEETDPQSQTLDATTIKMEGHGETNKQAA